MSVSKFFKPITLATLALPALLVLQVGCASHPEVHQVKAPAVDLQAYKTFAFFEPTESRRLGYSTVLGAHLKQATFEALQKQNYVYSEHNPDLRVNLFAMIVHRQDLRSTPAAAGVRGFVRAREIETVDYRQGTVMIDLVDARRNALVWRGVAEGRLDEKAVNNPGPAIQAAVNEIFAKYPSAND
jgi:hypothetical protein